MRKIEFNKAKDQDCKVACSKCKAKVWHKVITSVDETSKEEGPQHQGNGQAAVEWKLSFQTIQCQGCKSLSFRHVSANSEDFREVEKGKWEVVEHETLFPSRTEGRIPLKDAHIIPDQLRAIYVETIASLNNRQPLLSAIGVRAILETVCRDKKAQGKDLYGKINYLVSDGAMTRDGAEILQMLRSVSTEPPHETVAHSAEELACAMDVIEHILQGSYVLPLNARKIFSGAKRTAAR
jgi:hypothetical protein